MIKERLVEFSGPVGMLEGRLGNEMSANGTALLALHPHPLYGGTMDNNVVEIVVKSGQAVNYISLRLNFRGVGRSQGSYDNGCGEQDDVAAALAFLDEHFSPETKVLVGYSFGASVALSFCQRQNHNINHLLLLCPPPFLLPKDSPLGLPLIRRILLGENDQIAPPADIRTRMDTDKAKKLVDVIPGADHFFFGKEDALEECLVRHLAALE
jgi:hypothetical protein